MNGWLDILGPRRKRVALQDDAIPGIRATMARTLRGYHDEGHQVRGCCPLHGGDNPTAFVVSLAPGKIGVWICLTHCGGGNYNQLAERLGLEQMEGQEPPLVLEPPKPAPVYAPPEGLIDWDPEWMWTRVNADESITEIPACAFELLGAKLWVRRAADARGVWHVERRAWLPVLSGAGGLVGHVAALLTERYDGAKKYINSSGGLASLHMIFARQLRVWRPRTIVLVEGPADALRLIGCGIPAIPLLGARKPNDNIAAALASTYARALVCLDGDKAGRAVTPEIERQLAQRMSVRVHDIGDNADPASVDETVIDSLRAEVENEW